MNKNTQPNRTPYAIVIRAHNRDVHSDIERDIGKVKAGVFIFTLRVNDGNIIDYVVLEHDGY
ncbi:hypothetical protein A2377_00805 [Candidatus Roizmanbacteria bacterium RIFOXYB1_FULL_41_27]|nr:MAG: hypothetical protein A2377_00805 [Candidatus Roizmanbacteria bacterium RIFOXYB1_FULL_41_27]